MSGKLVRDAMSVGAITVRADAPLVEAAKVLWTTVPGLAVRHLMSVPAVTASEFMSIDEAATLMAATR